MVVRSRIGAVTPGASSGRMQSTTHGASSGLSHAHPFPLALTRTRFSGPKFSIAIRSRAMDGPEFVTCSGTVTAEPGCPRTICVVGAIDSSA
jgi:hypothetical protein